MLNKNMILFCMLLFGPVAKSDLMDTYQEGDKKKEEKPNHPRESNHNGAKKVLEKESEEKKGDKKRSVKPSQQKEMTRLPVTFEGEGLSGVRREGMVELHKDVRVVQGDLNLQSDKAKIFFNEASNEVKQVIATGNVKMTKIDAETGKLITANSDIAEFDAEQSIVTLKGSAKLLKGEDLIVGNLILYNLKTGWIKAEKVKGVVKP